MRYMKKEVEFMNSNPREELNSGYYTSSTNHSQQKVVNLDELEKYLDDGWKYVTMLANEMANERVIVKLGS
jgi:hypothetical protein